MLFLDKSSVLIEFALKEVATSIYGGASPLLVGLPRHVLEVCFTQPHLLEHSLFDLTSVLNLYHIRPVCWVHNGDLIIPVSIEQFSELHHIIYNMLIVFLLLFSASLLGSDVFVPPPEGLGVNLVDVPLSKSCNVGTEIWHVQLF